MLLSDDRLIARVVGSDFGS